MRSTRGSTRPTCRRPSSTTDGGTSPAPRRARPTRSTAAAAAESATDHLVLDQNVEAEGHEFFDLGLLETSLDHTLAAWSSDTNGDEHYTMRIRDIATGDDLPDELLDTTWAGAAWSADGRYLFYVTADEQERPFEVWRHALGTTQDDDVRIFSEPDERFFVGISGTRSDEWIVIHSGSKLSSEEWLLPAPTPRRADVVVARRDDVEYQLDHWGDRFVVLTNLEAVDFRVMTAPLGDPGEWEELIAHEQGRRITAVEPFAGHLAVHEWSAAQPRCGSSSRWGDDGRAPRRRAARRRVRAERRVGHRGAAGDLPVVDDPAHDVGRRRRHRRAHARQAHADAQRRPRPLRRHARVGHGSRRHGDPRRHPAPRRHTRRRHCAVRRLRLRRLRGVAAAVVLGGPVVARRPRRDVGARAPPRRRRARPAVVPRRQVAGQGQHVHRHDRGERAPPRRGLRRARPAGDQGWERGRAPRRRVRHDAPRPVRRGRCRGPVRRHRLDDERPDAAADGDGVGGVG